MTWDIKGVDDLIAEQALAKRELEAWQRGVNEARPGALEGSDVHFAPSGGESTAPEVQGGGEWWGVSIIESYTYIQSVPSSYYWRLLSGDAATRISWSIVSDPETWGRDIKLRLAGEPIPLRNGLRRRKGYREPRRWKDARLGRQRAWDR